MGLNESQKKERSDYLKEHLNISQTNPYAFISYASDNWKTVFQEVIVPMQEQYGLRVYADMAFDNVNDDWVTLLAKYLNNADVVIAFVSQRYIESYACFLEILAAVSTKIPIVFVQLENEKLKRCDDSVPMKIKDSVKEEIFKHGNNISIIAKNTSNELIQKMYSLYVNISTLLNPDLLSKRELSKAFKTFIDEIPITWKDSNNLDAIKGSIESINENVFDVQNTSQEAEPTSVVPDDSSAIQNNEPEYKQSKQPEPLDPPEPIDSPEPPKMAEKNPHRKKSKAVIAAAAAALCLLIIVGVLIVVNSKDNVVNMQYLYVTASGEAVKGKYTGEWKDDKPNGNGIMAFSDKTVYEGYWEDGKMNGQGTFTYAGGDEAQRASYEGEWKDGKMNGYGIFKWTDGKVFEGYFKDDVRNGYGTLTSEDGLKIYEGEYKNDKINGNGIYKYSSGDEYTGEFENDKRSGRGTFKWANGREYTGEWKDGVQNGYGIFKFAEEDNEGRAYYSGEWKDSTMNGQGTMIFAEGNEEGRAYYSGEWKDGKINGKGTMIFAEGDKKGRAYYYGDWEDGEINGKGIVIFVGGDKSGRISYDGEWKDGKMNGYGTFKWINGSVYTGEFVDEYMNGQGTMTYADGTVQSGTWQNNKFMG